MFTMETAYRLLLITPSYQQIPPAPDIIGLLFSEQRQMPCFCANQTEDELLERGSLPCR